MHTRDSIDGSDVICVLRSGKLPGDVQDGEFTRDAIDQDGVEIRDAGVILGVEIRDAGDILGKEDVVFVLGETVKDNYELLTGI